MSDIKLFRLVNGLATELRGDASDLEKPLQTLIENNLEPLLGIRFLASEYSTGKLHNGRIDSLGLDENSCPVILEYKRSIAESVINQGLYYLAWLMDHQAEFELLVMKKLGAQAAESIDWSAPRVVCIAADFTKYDGHAVLQISRNIELIRYRLFGTELLLLEQANAAGSASNSSTAKAARPSNGTAVATVVSAAATGNRSGDKSYAEWLEDLSPALRELLTSLENYIQSLGDDVQRKELKLYAAFKRLKNFATVVLQKNRIVLYLHLNPELINPLPINARNVRNSGHWGTGDLELSIAEDKDLDAAKTLIQQAYEGRAV
jgi:predicted transport protein